MKKIFLFIYFLTLSANSAIPTIESLFRNGENPNILEDTVVIYGQGIYNKEDYDNTDLSNVYSFKAIFDNKTKNKTRVTIAIYKYDEKKEKKIVTVKTIPDLETSISKSSKNEASLFYSILSVLVINKASPIMNYLKRIDNSVMLNKELINSEKVELFLKQKRYNKKVKNYSGNKENIDNPLHPKKEEDRSKVKGIIKQNFYLANIRPKFVKTSEGFNLEIKTEKFLVQFSNKNHQLKEIKISNEVQVNFSNYILFSGRHLMPKHFVISSNDKNYEIKLNKFYTTSSRKKTFRSLTKELREELKTSGLTNSSTPIYFNL